jgi:FMN phosphatase YigB (HAD superfamily)
MRVAIVHYHLGQGGVARVIEATSRILSVAGVKHVVLASGSDSPVLSDIPVRWIDGLGYRTAAGNLKANSLFDSMREAAAEALGGPPDIWHFHNHSLGKNCLLAEIVAQLAEEQERLILQIHDLAEDGRPSNYQIIGDCSKLYPFSHRIHYAFLNSRDWKCFIDAGLLAENASVLVNPVAPQISRTHSSHIESPALFFAPVRGIRRKNLGELVLLSALAPPGTRIAISRAPSNPEAIPIHDDWRRFSHHHRLPIEFDVVENSSPCSGAAKDFESWLDHATHFITTSVAEGFGLPFLESVAHGKPLVGRRLPHLAEDQAARGIDHPHLYHRLLVPENWIDPELLRSWLASALQQKFRSYRRSLPNGMIDASLDCLLHSGYLDFGNLPEPLQQQIIIKLADPNLRKIPLVQLESATLPVEDWFHSIAEIREPEASRETLEPYSVERFGKAITSLYSSLISQPNSVVRYLPAAEILSAHLTPAAFHFLLSSPASQAPATRYRAVIFDIYGTLLIAPHGGVRPCPAADPLLRQVLVDFGYPTPESPSTALHAAVLRHHAAAGVPFPEVDLRELWREILSLSPDVDPTPLVKALQSVWHSTQPMPGAREWVEVLAHSGLSLGLLSNAQCDTLDCLGDLAAFFTPDLTILSYQHRIAKPAPELFEILSQRLLDRGISPEETLYIGNDPIQDIAPAAAAGFKTALFIGHPDSFRPGNCTPDYRFHDWATLGVLMFA